MVDIDKAATRFVLLLLVACAPKAGADFSYRQTSRMTGGSLLKYASMIGGRITEPVTGTVSIKGNKMAHLTPHAGSIVDLDAKTVTTVNFDRQTYFVMTFDETKESMENVAAPDGAAITAFHVDLKHGPETKTILEKDTREEIVTVAMTITDSAGNKTNTQMESDLYPSSEIEGVKELRAFHKRMSGLPWSPGLQGMNRPEMAKALTGLFSKTLELDGLPLVSVLTIRGSVPGMPTGMSAMPDAPTGAAAGALGGKLGGLAAVMEHRRENQQNGTGDADASGPSGSGPLLEFTTTVTYISTKPVEASAFQIPEGFTQTDFLGQPR